MGRLIRFGLLGCVNVALSVVGLWFLVRQVGLAYPVAHVVVHVVVVSIAYGPSALWVFGQSRLSWPGFVSFHGTYLAQLAVSTAVLVALVDGAGLPLLPAQLVAIGAAVATSFVLQNFVVFGGERTLAEEAVDQFGQVGRHLDRGRFDR